MPEGLPPADDNLIKWLTTASLVAGLLVLVWRYLAGPAYREWLERWTFQADFRADWIGHPARPGIEARPGVMETLGALRSDRAATQARLHDLETQLAQHAAALAELRAEVDSLRDSLAEASRGGT